MKQSIEITNLFVSLSETEKEVLKGIDLVVKNGEVHAVMGPNGAGKTTLALTLMGHPNYKIKNQKSKIKIDGENVQNLLPEERAKKGLFVSFQQPIEVTGVSVLSFLRTAYKALHPNKKIQLSEFKIIVREALESIGLDETFMARSLNEGFSGGEKKRLEIVQLLILKPKFAVLDEIDSGLDVDSLKTVARAIENSAKKNKTGILLITHYQRILDYVVPDYVHVLIDGKIKKSDGIHLVRQIEKNGYGSI